jgi:hypothetical protein
MSATNKANVRRVTPNQAALRRRCAGLELHSGIELAINHLFRFTHRAIGAKALWSDQRVVWLGRTTFLDWAMNEDEFNIPWVVAQTSDAPQSRQELRLLVQEELGRYFHAQVSSLPKRNLESWLPLP